MNRVEKTLIRVSKSMRILELGPSYDPMVPKKEGWNSFSLDHGTKKELVAKYKNLKPDAENRIEEVDFVWRGGPIESAIPQHLHGTFDACVASHVIEHVPNLVGFFKAMERILTPAGLVCLAVPDKRYEFDFFKPLSTTGDVLQAFLEGRSRHSKRAIFDMSAYSVKNQGDLAWKPGREVKDITFFVPDVKPAYDQVVAYDDQESGEYVDIHGWYFTPSSFELIVLELGLLGVIDFATDILQPSSELCEFYATLKRGKVLPAVDGGAALRMELLKKTQLELGRQIELLKGNTGSSTSSSQPEAIAELTKAIRGLKRRAQRRHKQLSARLAKLEKGGALRKKQ